MDSRIFHGGGRILFIPYANAARAYDECTNAVATALEPMGFSVTPAHKISHTNLDKFDGIFIGGGNTFCLLDKLIKAHWLKPIAEAVKDGMPYMGSSAGSNVACPTIMTTNDMPITFPPSFSALRLIGIQINPHHPVTPDFVQVGETREQRIQEYHARNNLPVVGLREGSALTVTADKNLLLLGPNPARIFVRGQKPYEIEPGTVIEQGPLIRLSQGLHPS